MRKRLLYWLSCPKCSADLEISQINEQDEDRILSGQLRCVRGGCEFPIVKSIPRFVPARNFSDSFGYQWNLFSSTQLDETLGINLSADRFFKESRWPKKMEGELILEAGCGMGRFSRCAAETGAEVISFDYSNAVDANFKNNSKYGNLHFVQADIFNMPFKKKIFDRVFCFGVLQHTPDPKKGFFSLLDYGKPGAHLAFDVYRLSWKTIFWGQYYLRVISRRIPPARLFPFVKTYFQLVYKMTGWVGRWNNRVSKILSIGLATADYRGEYPLDERKMHELCLLDTFDKLSPAFDKPQTLREVKSWLSLAGLTGAEAIAGFNGIEARGQLP